VFAVAIIIKEIQFLGLAIYLIDSGLLNSGASKYNMNFACRNQNYGISVLEIDKEMIFIGYL